MVGTADDHSTRILLRRRLTRNGRPRRAITPGRSRLFSRERFTVVEEGADILALCKKGYRRGDSQCLLAAIDHCFATGKEVPLWARNAFAGRYLTWARFQYRTLDEAFGVELPARRVQFEGRRTREQLRPIVVLRAMALNQSGEPLGGALFARVGALLGIGESACEKIFYEAESAGLRALLRDARFSDEESPSS